MTQYIISSSNDTHWQTTNAKTIRGAKAACTRYYSVARRFMVGEVVTHPNGEKENVTIAVRDNGSWKDV